MLLQGATIFIMQKFVFSFLLLLFILPKNSFGATGDQTGDTSYNKSHKLSQQEFLDKYGRDDSSRALIKYYFQKRNAAKWVLFYGAGTGAVSAIAYALTWAGAGSATGLGAIFVIIIVLSGLFTGAIFALTGLLFLLTYSRKKLFRLLKNYHRGNGIPKKIRTAKAFKNLLKAESIHRVNK